MNTPAAPIGYDRNERRITSTFIDRVKNDREQQKWLAEVHMFAQVISNEPTGLLEQMTGQKAMDDNLYWDAIYIKAIDRGEHPKLTKWLTPKQLKAL